MTIKVLGAGFGRTGTNSLKLALEKLGFGPCYHMFEVSKNAEHVNTWNKAIDEDEVDWDQLFQGYHSAVDWPSVSFLPLLLKQYPDAKVILTLRDAEQWYESASKTIFQAMLQSDKNPDPAARERAKMSKRLILDNLFSGNHADKEHCIKIYENHIQQVLEYVPSNKILKYRVTEGWGPLCDFLAVLVPEDSFPNTNDRESFIAKRPFWAK